MGARRRAGARRSRCWCPVRDAFVEGEIGARPCFAASAPDVSRSRLVVPRPGESTVVGVIGLTKANEIPLTGVRAYVWPVKLRGTSRLAFRGLAERRLREARVLL